MSDPRDTARQWLAEALHEDPLTSKLPMGACDCRECRERIADAILSAPGVEVRASAGVVLPIERWGEQRIAILLPAEEGAGT